MSEQWYVLQVKPAKEQAVYHHLQQNDFDLFLPLMRCQPKNPRAAKLKPYFPGYLFVRADLEVVGIDTFTWLRGTHGLVQLGDYPAIVPDGLITDLKQRLALVQETGLKRGEPVRIVSGPLAGYEGIFARYLSGRERVAILLSMLGSVKLSASQVTVMRKVKVCVIGEY